jgi:2-polyprenyl-6-methoxyphenol hydroxylase-like FAD-dependent oxidoreductase
MNAPSAHETDVLVVGAGPAGLVLALWLTRMGVRVKIIDKTEQPTDCRPSDNIPAISGTEH